MLHPVISSTPRIYLRNMTLVVLVPVTMLVAAIMLFCTAAQAQSDSDPAVAAQQIQGNKAQAVSEGATSESSDADTPSSAETGAGPATTPGPSAYNSQDVTISPDDVLEVTVLDVKELSRIYRVSPTGSVTFPLLSHPLNAAGLTLDRFASEIESELRSAGLVSTPHVSVAIKESRSHSIAITGAVRRAMSYPVFGRTTLLDVLSEAGGPTEGAGGIVRVTRGQIAMQADRSAPQSVGIDLKRLLETGDPRLNIPIFPGDTVTVAPGGLIYVVGAVKKPGGFVLSTERQDMTVLQALALAEDTTSTARRGKAMIVRRDTRAAGGREQIPVDLGKIADGKIADVTMRPSDILFVPDSRGKKAMARGAEAAVQLVTGMAAWGRF